MKRSPFDTFACSMPAVPPMAEAAAATTTDAWMVRRLHPVRQASQPQTASAEETDEVRSALEGDVEAFGRLIDRCEAACLAMAYAVTRDAHLAADAVQEACLKGWKSRASLREPERFESWLLSIVRRCATDLVRRRPIRLVDTPPADGHACPDSMAPEEAAAARERRAVVREVIDALDEPSRIAVAMRYYDNRSSSEIARVLGCTPAAVDMRLKRARQRLAEMLEARGLGQE